MNRTRKPTDAARKTGVIRARIDPDLKDKAEAIFEAVGLNAGDAIRLFYVQVALHDGLPFDVRVPNHETRQAIRDARAGENVTTYANTAEMFAKLGI